MQRTSVITIAAVLVAVVCLAPVSASQRAKPKKPKPKDLIAELQVDDETARPGGLVQIKVFLTEPKPISTGLFDLEGGFDEIAGVSVFSPDADAYGLAWPHQGGIRLQAISPLASLGLADSDYPILTLTVRVPASATPGSVLPVGLDPDALILVDDQGHPYPTEARAGSVTVGSVPSVEEVIPGSDSVAAGDTVVLLGRDFTPQTRVRFDEVDLRNTMFVNPNRFDVVVDQPAVLHALEIKVRDRNRRSTYFSYQRTVDGSPSRFPILRTAEPAFPGGGAIASALDYPSVGPSILQVVAIQNIHLSPVTVVLSRSDGENTPPLLMPAATRLVLEMAELFGTPCPTACSVDVAASDTVQTLGFVATPLLDAVQLLPPR